MARRVTLAERISTDRISCMASHNAVLPDPMIDTEMAAYVLELSPRRVRELVQQGVLMNHGTRQCILLRYSEVTAYRNPKHL